jgi:drug/metabolite transporter (DMT)-like permease
MSKRVHIAGILFASIFGFSFMFSKIILELDSVYISPVGLIAYRFLIAFLTFEVLRLFKVVTIKFNKTQFKYLFMVALFQPILYFLLETYGLSLTSSGEAGMMIALIPIFVTILSSLILKEKPTSIQFLFIILSVSGVLFIQFFKSSNGIQVDFIGFLLLLGAVLSAALFNIASRTASKKLKPHELTYSMMFFGAITFNLIYVIELSLTSSINTYVTNILNIDFILPILYLGIVASIGGFFLVNYALSKAPAHITSIYSNLSTVVAVIAGALILRENLYFYHYIGGFMIITGVYGTIYFRKYKKMNFVVDKK